MEILTSVRRLYISFKSPTPVCEVSVCISGQQMEICGAPNDTGTGFSPSYSLDSLSRIIPPILHTPPLVTVTRRTSGRSLGTLQKAVPFWKMGTWHKRCNVTLSCFACWYLAPSPRPIRLRNLNLKQYVT